MIIPKYAAAAAAKSLQSCPDSVRPHRRQPIRLPRPWDSPGKNTGVGCHLLLQCMKVKSESQVAQSCPTLSDPMDCSLPGSSSMGFSRQKYWSGVPLPSPIPKYMTSQFFFLFLTLQYCIGFAIYQHQSATGIHVFPILNPPPSPYHPSGSIL